MNYDNNRSTIRENRGYKTKYSGALIRKQISEEIDSQKFKDAEKARQKARAMISVAEKGHTMQLLELGKLCAYIEVFDHILVSEQNIPQVGPFENPTKCESFQTGYEHGKMLTAQGFSEKNYRDYQIYYENKYLLNGPKHKK